MRRAAATVPGLQARQVADDILGSAFTLALLVFAGYYVGARIGLALTFAPSPISVLWPPNAILFAALLVSPRERAWIVIVAALPAHVLAELQGNVPLAMVASWFVSNCAEAVIGAALTRRLVGSSNPFDTLRGVLGFLGASLAAVLLSSFLDSALVLLNGWGERPFWELWETRTFANVATAWTIVPLIVSWAAHGRTFFREATPLRIAEVVGVLLIIGAIVLFAPQAPHAASGPATLVFIPLLLWVALRFDMLGVSSTFALVALVVIWYTGHTTAPYDLGSPSRDARAAQLFMLIVAPTLLCLAAALFERRGVEARLRLGERRFAQLLEATRDTVYERDVATDRFWWAGNGLAQFGYDAATRPESLEAWRALVHPEDRLRVQRAAEDAIRTGVDRVSSEFRLRRRNGSYAYVHVRGFVVRNDKGEPVRTIGSIADVSDRREIEDMTASVAHTARLASVGELAAAIAHEINQPMSAILANVDAAEMLLDADEMRMGELREILNDIRNDDLRASDVIRHIRSFAHKQPTQTETFALDAVLADALRIVAPAAHLRSVDVAMECPSLPLARGDRIQVQQVLVNLLTNAVDAVAACDAARRMVRMSASRAGDDALEVAVTDSGPGIAPDDIGRIFDSFFTTKRDGMGLGLAIARSLVNRNGGDLRAENNVAGGATFRFTVPTAAARGSRPSAGSSST